MRLRSFSFFVFFAGSLGAISYFANQKDPQQSAVAAPTAAAAVEGARKNEKVASETAHRRELIEVLDRLVSYEHYYRSVYGHFTKLLNRIGFSIPRALASTYEIRVAEASSDRLVLTAFSEVDGKTVDNVSIDQDFQVNSSFPIPSPRPEYLRLHALKHLRLLRDSPPGRTFQEQGVYKGYFQFAVKNTGEDHRNAFAVGTRPPVLGLQLDLENDKEDSIAAANSGLGELLGEFGEINNTTGQQSSGIMSTLEEAYLAQKIFRGEIGRYAKSWSELSKITDFRFEGQEHGDIPVPFGDNAAIPEIDVGADSATVVEPIGEASRGVSSSERGLEIEPIGAGEMSGNDLEFASQRGARKRPGSLTTRKGVK